MLKLQIKELIQLKGLRNTAFVLLPLGIAKSTAYSLYKGKANSISIKHIFALCQYLNCTPNDLFKLDEQAHKILPANHELNKLTDLNPDEGIGSELLHIPVEKIMELGKQMQKDEEEEGI